MYADFLWLKIICDISMGILFDITEIYIMDMKIISNKIINHFGGIYGLALSIYGSFICKSLLIILLGGFFEEKYFLY